MSERNGTCPTCQGLGQVPDPDDQAGDGKTLILVRVRGEPVFLTFSGFKAKDCGRCGGTAFDGDAMTKGGNTV